MNETLDVEDVKRLKVTSTTVGFLVGLAVVVGSVVWSAAGLANRIDTLENRVEALGADVAVIEGNTGTDSSILSALDDIREGVAANDKAISDMSAARLRDLDRYVPTWTFDVYADTQDQMVRDIEALTTAVEALIED